MKYFVSKFLLVLILTNCSNNQPSDLNSQKIEYEDYYSKTWQNLFPFDNQGNNGLDNISYFHNTSQDFLAISKGIDSAVYLIDLGKLSVFKKINSFDLTPEGTTCIDNHAIAISENKIHILYSNGTLYVEDDGKLKLITSLNSNSKLKSDGLEVYYNIRGSELFVVEDKLFFQVWKNYDENATYTEIDYNFPTVASYSLKTNEIEYVGIGYPKELFDNYYGVLHEYSFLYSNDSLYYFFEAIPEIWINKLSDKKVVKKRVRSKFQNQDIQPIDLENRIDEILHSEINGRYSSLVFDPYKQIYYRFYQHPKSTHPEGQYAIMILSKNFNVIYEEELPKAVTPWICAPTEAGLVLSKFSLEEKKKEISLVLLKYN